MSTWWSTVIERKTWSSLELRDKILHHYSSNSGGINLISNGVIVELARCDRQLRLGCEYSCGEPNYWVWESVEVSNISHLRLWYYSLYGVFLCWSEISLSSSCCVYPDCGMDEFIFPIGQCESSISCRQWGSSDESYAEVDSGIRELHFQELNGASLPLNWEVILPILAFWYNQMRCPFVLCSLH